MRSFPRERVSRRRVGRSAMQTKQDDGGVVIYAESALCSEVKANGHALVADEPAAVGGNDAGPTPYDYLLAALGSCTAITVRMYADRKGWPLESVTVRVEHGRVHAKD